MKSVFRAILFLIFISGDILPQDFNNAWIFGFGLDYPQLINTNAEKTYFKSFGFNYALQKNYGGVFGWRLKTSHLALTVKHPQKEEFPKTSLNTLNLEFTIIPFPSYTGVPYLILGGGGMYFHLRNPIDTALENHQVGAQINVGLGSEFLSFDRFKFKTEIIYHHTITDHLDGFKAALDRADSYLSVMLGVNIYLPSAIEEKSVVEPPKGIEAPIYDFTKFDLFTKNAAPSYVSPVTKGDFPIKEGTQWTLSEILFDYNKSTLRPESYPMLDFTIHTLQSEPGIIIEIRGFTDNVGSYEKNMQLSWERAQSVRDYLVTKGVNPKKLTTAGYGPNYPVGDNSNPEGRQQNRRIEFKILKK